MTRLATRPPAGLCAALPRLQLAQLPTPLEPAPGLAAALGVPGGLWIKREDMTGLALGGNKPRQLEFILAEAVAAGADSVITTAAAQSNFCRAMAAAAARAGLGCHLLLRGRGDEAAVGNLLLDRLLGAEIEFIATTDPYDPAVATRLAAIAERLAAAGRRPRIVHLTTGSGPLAAAAFVSGAEELADQMHATGVVPAALYVTVGSGLTLAGLALGLKHLGLPTRVVGISAQQPAGFIGPLVVQRANEAADLLGLATRLEPSDFDLDDRHIGPHYGALTPDGVAAITLAARSDGLLLDPVYTGKCMAGLIADIGAGRWARQPVAFLHSGGTPTLFAHGGALVSAL